MKAGPIAFTLGFLAGACVMWLWMRRRDNPQPTREGEIGPAPTVSQGPTAQVSVDRVQVTVPPPERTGQRKIPAAPLVNRASEAVLAPVPMSRPAAILTRTAPSQGAPLYDSFAVEGERGWSVEEQRQLVSLYEAQHPVREIAMAMQLDQKQVAAQLIRLLLDPKGRIDNDDEMPKARTRYSEHEIRRMREAYETGVSLPVLAKELGRSQLGVGWRMLDHHIPLVPKGHAFPLD